MPRVRTNPFALVAEDADSTDRALRDYERELISLGRLAEILGLDRDQATALIASRGLPLRIGPRTAEEAIEELRFIERIESQ